MHRVLLVLGLLSTLVWATTANAQSLEDRVAALEQKLQAVQWDAPAKTLVVSGANLQVVNGTGDTNNGTGLGNLLVGYNTGGRIFRASHNVVVGDEHILYSGTTCGAAIGEGHRLLAEGAVALGGVDHYVAGEYGSVFGGTGNQVRRGALGAAIMGGLWNRASGEWSAMSGGYQNVASGEWAWAGGGNHAQATATLSTTVGSLFGRATGVRSTVVGGLAPLATGLDEVVIGGP
jgi:hypothetical protein